MLLLDEGKRTAINFTSCNLRGNLTFALVVILFILIIGNRTNAFAPVSHKLKEADRIISFSGFDWLVKSSKKSFSGTLGPGNNYFSNSENNVWIDHNGYLHLRITRQHNKWYCAEVILVKPLGYKKYVFEVKGTVDQFHPNVVGGIFTYVDGVDNTEEIDIEFSKWGDRDKNTNSQYAIQPSDSTGNFTRFRLDLKKDKVTTHLFNWQPGKVDFESYFGSYSPDTPDSSKIISRWNYVNKDVPVNLSGKIHINLWLFQKQLIGPSDYTEA
ncbi:MAG: glycoside hydrolase family 16 protein, partial [Mariniphaga sp.]